MSTNFDLDDTLVEAISNEALDGRKMLMDDLRRGFHAKVVLSERHHSQTSRRTGTVWGGDGEFREVARAPAASFQYLYNKHGADEMNGDDLMEWYMKKNPDMRVHYTPKTPVVFFPAAQTAGIIQASKYTPARA